jgi:hypothetical protein
MRSRDANHWEHIIFWEKTGHLQSAQFFSLMDQLKGQYTCKPTDGKFLLPCSIIQIDYLVMTCKEECIHHVDSDELRGKSKERIFL